MKTKANINIFIAGNAGNHCVCQTENLPKLKLATISVEQIFRSLIQMGCTPLVNKLPGNDYVVFTPEVIRSMTIAIPAKDCFQMEVVKFVEIGKIDMERSRGIKFYYGDDTGYWPLNEDLLANLLWLGMYAENKMGVSCLSS